MTLLTCPSCCDLSGAQEDCCESCGAPLTIDAARALHRAMLDARGGFGPSRFDSIGPERSEGPLFAPRTLDGELEKCVHRGNTPAQSDIPASSEGPIAAILGTECPQGSGLGCGTLGVASDGKPVARDPFGLRARLRDALHGDDGSPDNGRVGAKVTGCACTAEDADRLQRELDEVLPEMARHAGGGPTIRERLVAIARRLDAWMTNSPTCVGCGCTNNVACSRPACFWVSLDPPTCSRCWP